MNVLHKIITSLGGLNARALLRTGLIATALVAFATVAIPIAGAVSGHGGTSAAFAGECVDSDAPECQEEPTKTPEEEKPTKTPEEEEPTKTPDDTPTSTPVDTATPTDVPMDTPTDVPTDVPTDTPEDRPTNTPFPRPTSVPTEQPMVEPTDMPEEPTALPDSGSGFGPDLVLSWYWYVLVAALLAIGLGVLIKPSYN